MKTQTMRWIDRHAGNPLCRLLAPVASWFVRGGADGPIIVCKFFGLGSIVLSRPLLSELTDAGRDVVYLTFASSRPAVEVVGAEKVITIDASGAWRFATDVIRAVLAIRRLKPAVFLNLEFFSRFAALMSVASGAPVRAGFHILHLPVGGLYTHKANFNVYRHAVENFLNVGHVAGVIDEPKAMAEYADGLPRRPEDNACIPAALGSNYIVVNAETSETNRDLRSWPKTQWAELIERLRAAWPDHAVALVGTEQIKPAYAEVLSRLDDTEMVIDIAGATDFAAFHDVVAGAALVISVDSGPFHLSVYARRPTIGLFGPESPLLFGSPYPWVRVVYKGLICSPCQAIYDAKESVLDCRDNQCMKRISATEVIAAAEDLMAAS